jgi:hypothetical protein
VVPILIWENQHAFYFYRFKYNNTWEKFSPFTHTADEHNQLSLNIRILSAQQKRWMDGWMDGSIKYVEGQVLVTALLILANFIKHILSKF